MISIDEARKIQRERSKKALSRFILFLIIDILVISLSFLLSERSDTKYFYATVFVILIIFGWQIKLSKIYLFATPKEFTGIVQYYNVRNEVIKNNLSNLPGDTYKTHDCLYGELIVENSAGCSITKKFVYTEEYNEINIGSVVTILRFIDRPIINK